MFDWVCAGEDGGAVVGGAGAGGFQRHFLGGIVSEGGGEGIAGAVCAYDWCFDLGRSEAGGAAGRLDGAAVGAVGHDQRARWVGVVGEAAVFSWVFHAADNDIGGDACGGEDVGAAGGNDEQAGGAGEFQGLGVFAGEVDGIAGTEDVPREEIVSGGVQRMADDHDGALGVGRDEDDIASVGLHAEGGVDGGAGAGDLVVDVEAGVVDADGGEEVDVGIALFELEEGDGAAPAGDDDGVVEMGDVAGRGEVRDAGDGDVLGVADDG